MSASAPLLSIAVPTYRGARYLGAAIESALSQSFRDFELIVLDDNSPDDTPAVVQGFDDPRIRYVRNPANLGPQGNWNLGLELARGRYFKLLPHDDLLLPGCLERQVKVLDDDRDHDIALVFGAREVLGPQGRVLVRRGYPGGHEGAIDRGAVVRACVRRGTNLIGEPGAVMFRKGLAQRVGPFDATDPYVIDLDYWCRLLAHGDAYYCEAPLAAFRVSEGSWSVAIGRAQDRDFMGFVQRIARAGRLPRLTSGDLLAARVSAKLNMWARAAFYMVHLPRTQRR